MKVLNLFILFGIMFCSIFISGCSSPVQVPTVSVSSVDIANINLKELSLNITLSIYNPNLFNFEITSVAFDVLYQSGGEFIPLSHGEKGAFSLKPGENVIVIPVTIQNAELLRAGINFVMDKKLTLKVKGNVKPNLAGFSPPIPFETTTTVPLGLPVK